MMTRILMILMCLFIFFTGNALAVPIFNITKLAGEPIGWDPINNSDQYDILNLDTITIPNPGGIPVVFHVGIKSGILDLHIVVPAGQEPGPIDLTQDLFQFQKVNDLTADMWGTSIPFCTFFTVDSNVSFDIRATVPEPSTYLLLGSGLAGLFLIGRKRSN